MGPTLRGIRLPSYGLSEYRVKLSEVKPASLIDTVNARSDHSASFTTVSYPTSAGCTPDPGIDYGTGDYGSGSE